ncbi:MAG: hypothetical protein ACOYEW_06925, partial [Anaerolineae bacterium]
MDRMQLPGKEDWPLVQQRYEAWWEGAVVDRVPIAVHAPKTAQPPDEVPPEGLLAYWTDPETVIARQRSLL